MEQSHSIRIYHVLFLGLIQSLGAKGWEVSIEPPARGGHVDIRLCHGRKRMAVLIELKSCEKQAVMERDANTTLKQIEEKNYRNLEGLPNIRTLREYSICWLSPQFVCRGLELDDQNQ